MTIAVTAATGHLGTLVIDALLDTTPASEIVAVARDAAKAQRLADRGVEVRIADYDDRAALDQALAGVDQVLLISSSAVGQRLAQHSNVIDAAVAQGVSRLIYTSAARADTSTLPVAPEHKETEAYLATAGIDHVLLRNGWYHENYASVLESAAQTGQLVTSAGDGLVYGAARADFALAAAAALTSEEPLRHVYELAGDTGYTQAELAATVADLIGTPVETVQVSTDEHIAILTGAGLDGGTAGFVAALDTAIKAGDLDEPSRDLSGLTGRPTTSLADSLRALL